MVVVCLSLADDQKWIGVKKKVVTERDRTDENSVALAVRAADLLFDEDGLEGECVYESEYEAGTHGVAPQESFRLWTSSSVLESDATRAAEVF